jgi:hypothetical protein
VEPLGAVGLPLLYDAVFPLELPLIEPALVPGSGARLAMTLILIRVRAAPSGNYHGTKGVEAPRILWSAVAAAAVAAAVDALYVAIIASEGEGELGTPIVVLVAGLLGAAAVTLAVASRPVRLRRPLLVGAALVLAILTVLGIASIGVLVLPAAVLAWVAAARVLRRR